MNYKTNIAQYKSTDKQLLNSKETAELLNLQENTLAVWRCNKKSSLKFIKVGRLIRYKLSDIEDFLQYSTYMNEVSDDK